MTAVNYLRFNLITLDKEEQIKINVSWGKKRKEMTLKAMTLGFSKGQQTFKQTVQNKMRKYTCYRYRQ